MPVDLIAMVFEKEGDVYADQNSNPPIDQPTGPGGIILDTLSEYLGRPATVDELKALTRATATPIVDWKLQQFSRQFSFDKLKFTPLRAQMIDFAYNSGPTRAIRWLQRSLRVNATGIIDYDTEVALIRQDMWLVHQALIGARAQMVSSWGDDPNHKERRQWVRGIIKRTVSHSLIKV